MTIRRLLAGLGVGAGLLYLCACTTTPDDGYIPPPPPPPGQGRPIRRDPPRVVESFETRSFAVDDYDVAMRIRNAPSPQSAIQLAEMRGAELCLEAGYKFYKPTEQGMVRGQPELVHVRVKCFRVYVDHRDMKTAGNTIRLVRRAYGL